MTFRNSRDAASPKPNPSTGVPKTLLTRRANGLSPGEDRSAEDSTAEEAGGSGAPSAGTAESGVPEDGLGASRVAPAPPPGGCGACADEGSALALTRPRPGRASRATT